MAGGIQSSGRGLLAGGPVQGLRPAAGTHTWTEGSPGRQGSSPALFTDLELWGAGVPRVAGLHRPGGLGPSCPLSRAHSPRQLAASLGSTADSLCYLLHVQISPHQPYLAVESGWLAAGRR